MPVTLADSIKFVGKIRVERKLYKGQFNMVLYSAYEPCNVSTHATLMCLNGKWYGKIGTKMPNNKKNEDRAYEVILSAFPESKFGQRKGGDIFGTPK